MATVSYNQNVVTTLIQEAITRQPRGAATKLAQTLGVTPQTVSKWVKGETVPRMEDWTRIAEALGLPSDTFHRAVFGDEQVSPYANRLDEMERRIAQIEQMIDRLLRQNGPRRSPKGGPGAAR